MEKKKGIGARIEALREFKNADLEWFITLLGYKQTSYNTLKSDEGRGVSLEVIQNLKNEYADLNLNWLVMGEGDMLLDAKTNSAKNQQIITNGSGNVQIQTLEGCKEALHAKDLEISKLQGELIVAQRAIIELQKEKKP